MNYTAKKKEFIVTSILSFIEANDSTEADIRRAIIMYLNNDSEFFTDAQLDTFESAIQRTYHPEEESPTNAE